MKKKLERYTSSRRQNSLRVQVRLERSPERPAAPKGIVRYAVVGVGHIAQEAVLPAFGNAKTNSRLVALVSDSPKKLRSVAKAYKCPITARYDDYEALLRSGEIDAVYIALPNDMHSEYSIRAANAGCHVLCEKPLALNEEECGAMIAACSENSVKLMTAYRLHFERSNLEAIRLVESGKLGEPRIFQSLFTMQVKNDNYRVKREQGGGPLYDLGIYCINAARYLFRAEPTEVFAYTAASKTDKRFRDIEEMVGGLMRFPGERLAQFTASFGAADSAVYTLAGTKGILKATDGYEYAAPVTLEVITDGKTEMREYARRDQFGPELVYFSDCILQNREPEPGGIEGLKDVHIIRAFHESARLGRPVKIGDLTPEQRPSLKQEIYRPPVRKRAMIRVSPAHKDN